MPSRPDALPDARSDARPDARPNARIWRIAGPSIAANCSTALIGLVDSWAVGHLPDPTLLAAIGLGTFLVNFVLWGCGFLRMGTTGQVAQAHGADDVDRVARILVRAGLVGLALGLALLGLRGLIIDLGLGFFAAPPALDVPVRRYTDIRLLSLPAVLGKLAVLGFLIGTGRAGRALSIEVAANLSNAALTVLFVTHLGWGIAGAAWASVIAELLALLLASSFCLQLLGASRLARAATDRRLRRLAALVRSLGSDLLLIGRTLFLLGSFAWFWRVSAQLGADAAGANQVLMQFILLAALALDGIAYAAEAEVGRAVGRRDRALYDRMLRLTTLWALGFAAVTSGLYLLAGEAIIALFTDHPAIRQAADGVLLWAALMPLAAVWSYQFDGVYVGLTAYLPMLVTMGLAAAGFALALALLPATNGGLWAGFTLFMGLRGLAQGLWLPALRHASFPEPSVGEQRA